MNRREALRNIGLGTGYVVAAPTLLSILQSCSNEPTFQPQFLTPGQGFALQQMTDLIIPSDDEVPGAKEVNIAEFIDSFWAQVPDEEDTAQLKDAWAGFESKFKEEFNKELTKGTAEDYTMMLDKYLKASPEDRAKYAELRQNYSDSDDPNVTMDPDAASFELLGNIRGMTIWGWKTSEEVGENVLWYDPVPGQYVGCLPISEAGNGKTMSL
ncbi:gluconate 2-dehydrogenase subunit 3 family protein [Croceiramulus getboli]|nr:gluconate 2-dehydrogenase subunit 3 family protein [Flavobacteriaceae bacterium YJPT1-3]